MAAVTSGYPAVFEVDPPAPQSRLTVFFRLLLLIPHVIVIYFLMLLTEILTFLAWFAILFTGRYPAGFVGLTGGTLRWISRVYGYQYLLTGKYPPFSMDAVADYPIRPSVTVALEGRNRLTVFFRPLMLIPHVVVLYVIGIAASVALLISWLVALITGSVPAGLHGFLAGVQRWAFRVFAYALLLTDEYPPFSLS